MPLSAAGGEAYAAALFRQMYWRHAVPYFHRAGHWWHCRQSLRYQMLLYHWCHYQNTAAFSFDIDCRFIDTDALILAFRWCFFAAISWLPLPLFRHCRFRFSPLIISLRQYVWLKMLATVEAAAIRCRAGFITLRPSADTRCFTPFTSAEDASFQPSLYCCHWLRRIELMIEDTTFIFAIFFMLSRQLSPRCWDDAIFGHAAAPLAYALSLRRQVSHLVTLSLRHWWSHETATLPLHIDIYWFRRRADAAMPNIDEMPGRQELRHFDIICLRHIAAGACWYDADTLLPHITPLILPFSLPPYWCRRFHRYFADAMPCRLRWEIIFRLSLRRSRWFIVAIFSFA